MTNTDIDILHYDRPPEAQHIPAGHFVLGLDCHTGETFGNAASQKLDATLCAAHDGIEMLVHAGATLFPLEWLYAEYPARRQLWESQRDALAKHAQENGLPFTEPF
jgi:hypothetical protein